MGKLTFCFGGDLVPTSANEQFFCDGKIEQIIDQSIAFELRQCDFKIYNLETSLCRDREPILKCGPNLKADPKTINGISKLQPTVLALANNHILDYGEKGLEDTMSLLQENGIPFFGAGVNAKEAKKPYIIEKDGIKVGLYNCAEHEFTIAKEQQGGANPFDPLESPGHVQDLKRQCDYVIVLYHGGKEHYRYPSPDLQKRCRKLVDSGADLVLCQHSHCIGCQEIYQQGTIVYGQGNFIFTYDGTDNEYWANSLLIKVTIENKLEIEYLPLMRTECGTRKASEAETKEIMEAFFARSEEIKIPGLIESKYLDFSKQLEGKYLSCFAGILLEDDALYDKNFADAYSTDVLTAIINFIECEAHSELLLTSLKDTVEKRRKKKNEF